MNQRTLLLAGAAAAVFILYLFDSGYRSFIEKPTQRYEGELKSIESKISDANTSQITGRRLAIQLDEYAARALPYDPALARSSYQDWLLKLVEQHEMESASVDANTPRPVEIRSRISRRKSRLVGHRIGFNLHARTTLNKLTDFLYDFHRSAQLHKIRSFSLSPLVNGNQLDLSLAIETFSMEATEREGGLSPLVRSNDGFPLRPVYNEFVNRNLFAKGFSKSLGQVRLNAITENRFGILEAWFAVGSPPKTQIIGTGGTLDIPLHTVKVVSFDEGRVELTVNDFRCWISLGQTLASVLGESQSPTVVDSVAAKAEESPSSPSDVTP
ncbi:hypothetical protein Q31b_11830 [Novipirellula aureliae]|uniref:Pilus assembly protein, PilO n=1 Tax=Novipirellula aureliae TaxID=2527966 RepID=A0A5C6EBZ7_9BACT|nr:hypothetical protein [Novipirellula aureliae]TWU46005.1 hypothetical protein Q31b_11830 [Novipirellula aureliae]